MDTIGAEFTWFNGRSDRRHTNVRLERVITNATWYATLSDTACRTLVREFFDHHPLLLKFDSYVRKYPRPFRFMSCGILNENLSVVVKENWEQPIIYVSNPMIRMMLKLKRLKMRLKNWNWSIFGDVDRNVELENKDLSRI